MRCKGWLLALLLLGAWSAAEQRATAQSGYYHYYPGYQLSRFFYYPYHFFPHNYWPVMGPRWPEAPNQPYMRPPAYQAYPAFREPNWRYELWTPQRYHQGQHFWLDQF